MQTEAVQNEQPTAPDFRSDISRETANRAYEGISHSPERRGAQVIEEYQGMLVADYLELKAIFEKGGKPELFEEEFARYRQGLREKFNAWLYAKSRCLSSMIVGPSNFPVRRAEKANQSEHNRFTELQEFQQRAKKAMRKTVYPFGDGTVISGLDPEAVDKLREKLANLKNSQETMKAANKIVRDKKLDDAAKVERLAAMGLRDPHGLLKPDFCGRVGFADYALQNNLANIKRVEGRIAELSKAETAPKLEVKTDNGIEVFEDEGRIQIRFPGKPEEKIRALLRSNAFKWSPTRSTWVRQATGNARAAAEYIIQQVQPS